MRLPKPMVLQQQYSLVTTSLPLTRIETINLRKTYDKLKERGKRCTYDPEVTPIKLSFWVNGDYTFNLFSTGSVTINVKGSYVESDLRRFIHGFVEEFAVIQKR